MDDIGRYLHFRMRRPRSSRHPPNISLSNSIPTNVGIDLSVRNRPIGLSPPKSSEYHAFCDCWKERFNVNECTCGERGKTLEWVWDVDTKSNCTHLVNNNQDVRFHLHFSGGTAVIKGKHAFTSNQYYWEVKMTSLVYGTDMMVGIGTKDADVHKVSDRFCSVLGIDSETWGLSYSGLFHHQGTSTPFSNGFGQGAIIGVHLDMWHGTLSFYKNRQPLGIACKGLKGKVLYPMVSSTAARSGMRIIHSVSFPSSLQFMCCVALRKAVPQDKSVFDVVPMPPGMQVFLSYNLGWLLGESDMLEQNAELMARNNELPTVPESMCTHEHLTCNDCNTPVFAGSNRDVDDSFLPFPPTQLLQVGLVRLQELRNRNHTAEMPLRPGQAHSSQSRLSQTNPHPDNDDEDEERSRKRRKLTHHPDGESSDVSDSD